ncbi:MAG: 2-succinyl-6-hydroxy-2,4-cyclohexadiene-1-carboxylate synthase [candidate division KSB1 bacterium]|nr:2-succinyl-6-hydroxy-2,4-cyclohexadiene-1-carboxylate synthase [candidate division KSB1 bacterium]MDQ7064691.1 2-succinyl-6-hydroxy-2,4-cyclohexadiene-1-carboxylate synthase [candidate division KSB1 bacterium]
MTVGKPDIRFHAHRYGRRGAPRALLLHGFLGNCADWQSVAAHPDFDLDALAPDLPGHGLTEAPSGAEGHGMTATARALIDLLEREAFSPCGLIGYSMGGRLALYLALQYPEHFDWLVLESASPGLDSKDARAARRQHDARWIERLQTRSLPEFLREWYAQPIFASLREHPDFPHLLQRRLRNRAEGLIQSLRHMGTGVMPSLWPKLAELSVPTLLLAGERDPKFVTILSDMHSRCKNARFVVAKDTGHTIHFEHPDLFVKTIHEFIQNRRRGKT